MHLRTLTAFDDELVKIAVSERENSQTLRDQKRLDLFHKTLAVGGSAYGAHALGVGANRALVGSLIRGEQGLSTSPQHILDLHHQIHPEGMVVPVEGGLDFAKHIYHGTPTAGIPRGAVEEINGPGGVHLPKTTRGVSIAPTQVGPHITAHELGHGRFSQGKLGRAAIGAKRFLGTHQTAVGRASAIGSYGMALQDPDSAASKLAPVVGGLRHLPTLVDEAGATFHGLRGMKALGMKGGKASLAKAFGTYAAAAAPSVLGPAGVRQFMKYKKNKAKESAP